MLFYCHQVTALRAIISELPSHYGDVLPVNPESQTVIDANHWERSECTQHRPEDELRIVNNDNEAWKRLCSNMAPALNDGDETREIKGKGRGKEKEEKGPRTSFFPESLNHDLRSCSPDTSFAFTGMARLSWPGLIKYQDSANPWTVTHPSTNRARRRVTTLMEVSTLPLRQTVTRCYSAFLFRSNYASASCWSHAISWLASRLSVRPSSNWVGKQAQTLWQTTL